MPLNELGTEGVRELLVELGRIHDLAHVLGQTAIAVFDDGSRLRQHRQVGRRLAFDAAAQHHFVLRGDALLHDVDAGRGLEVGDGGVEVGALATDPLRLDRYSLAVERLVGAERRSSSV